MNIIKRELSYKLITRDFHHKIHIRQHDCCFLNGTKWEIFSIKDVISYLFIRHTYSNTNYESLINQGILKYSEDEYSRIFYEEQHNKCIDNLKNITDSLIVLILLQEFPSLNLVDLEKHIINYDVNKPHFVGNLVNIIRTPLSIEHDAYMDYIRKLMSDIVIYFDEQTYGINIRLPLIDDLNNIIFEYMK